MAVDNHEQNGNGTAQMIAATEGEAIFARAGVSVSSDVQRVVDLGQGEWDRVLDVNLRIAPAA